MQALAQQRPSQVDYIISTLLPHQRRPTGIKATGRFPGCSLKASMTRSSRKAPTQQAPKPREVAARRIF